MIEIGSARRGLDRVGAVADVADDLLPQLFLLAVLAFAVQWRSAMFVATDMESN